MKRLFSVASLMVAMACSTAVAVAQDMPPQPPQGGTGSERGMRFQMPSFTELDKNKDKKLSRDEIPSQFPPQAFDRLDENKDGFIDEEEWGRRRMGGGGGNFGERLSRFMDADGNGKISREEFSRINQVFDALDQNRDGELTQEELGRFFQAMNEAQNQATGGVDVNNLFQNTDKNKDGKLTADEMTDARMFRALDLNKDGSVTKEEAEQALKQIERARQQRQSPPSNN